MKCTLCWSHQSVTGLMGTKRQYYGYYLEEDEEINYSQFYDQLEKVDTDNMLYPRVFQYEEEISSGKWSEMSYQIILKTLLDESYWAEFAHAQDLPLELAEEIPAQFTTQRNTTAMLFCEDCYQFIQGDTESLNIYQLFQILLNLRLVPYLDYGLDHTKMLSRLKDFPSITLQKGDLIAYITGYTQYLFGREITTSFRNIFGNNSVMHLIAQEQEIDHLNDPTGCALVDGVLETPWTILWRHRSDQTEKYLVWLTQHSRLSIEQLLQIREEIPNFRFNQSDQDRLVRYDHDELRFHGNETILMQQSDEFFRMDDIEWAIQHGYRQLFDRLLPKFGRLLDPKNISELVRSHYDPTIIAMALEYGYDPNSRFGILRESDTVLNWVILKHRDPQMAKLLLHHGARRERHLIGVLNDPELNQVLSVGEEYRMIPPAPDLNDAIEKLHQWYQRYRVADLKEKLRQWGLPLSGRRDQLIWRLVHSVNQLFLS